jgi:hypothetical protein
MRVNRIMALAILMVAAASPVAAWAQTTALVLHSQPGDPVGGGTDRTFFPADGVFTPSTSDNVLNVYFNGGPHWWYLYFAAPANAPLTVGVYEDATRWPFQSPTKPGLSVGGDDSGCNMLNGRFEVVEAVYGPGGQVERFAATFEQHCEGLPAALASNLPPADPSHITVAAANSLSCGASNVLMNIALP